ncbi:MAG: HD domain-containing protein, partial [Actinomycetes bacterium]
RELFEHAALLHDIGTFLSYSDHHVHSSYLIRHADLLGFDENETATMAATALFHRKASPGARHPAFAELDRPTRKAVRLLSVLLRLAEYMDRSHAGAIAHAALRADGPGTLVLEVRPAKDWHLESWRLESGREAIEKGLGRTLTVEALEP